MSFDFSTLVTDRTQADVNRVKQISEKIKNGTASESELAEFNSAAMKGAYNYTDLNRVGLAIQYVSDLLNNFGYLVSVSPKANWTENDYPTYSDIALYLSDLSKLREVFAMMQSTPDIPKGMEKLTFAEANNIEKILVDINELLMKSTQAWFYSGELFAGEV